jgi:hypothetical protein
MFKQKKLKTFLKNNPPLPDILRSDLCKFFVKGFIKGKKESTNMVSDKFLLELLDCLTLKGKSKFVSYSDNLDLVADSGHLCHYSAIIMHSGNSILMDQFLSDVKYMEKYFDCLKPENCDGHFLVEGEIEVPNILYYFSQSFKAAFECML